MPDEHREQAQLYQKLVLDYEALGERIQGLLKDNGGYTENMSPTDMQTYRDLASQRDELYNQIKAIEATWLDDDSP